MNHWTRLALTGALFASAGLGSCVSMAEHQKVAAANRALQEQRDELERYAEGLASENDRLKGENQQLQGTVKDAAWVKRQREQMEDWLARYKDKGPSNVPGVRKFETAEGSGYEIKGDVVFNSGQAELTEAGKTTLRQLVADLEQDGRTIRVDGHTDGDPIRRSSWKTNLRLSANRALAVADFLIKAGLPMERVTVAGFGANRQRVEETDGASKRRNRRVEIMLLNAN